MVIKGLWDKLVDPKGLINLEITIRIKHTSASFKFLMRWNIKSSTEFASGGFNMLSIFYTKVIKMVFPHFLKILYIYKNIFSVMRIALNYYFFFFF
jgi:hypothetical protein